MTLVHGDWLHLFFNMYALFLVGPGGRALVRLDPVRRVLSRVRRGRLCGQLRLRFRRSTPSGASGAIFGLFGILLAAGRAHQPIDRASRGIVQQMGVLIAINLVFGFASGA